ncbi:MAG TPA: hypothetical protein VJN18_27030 [Polyangiaceae bacterium]|nr:hypothetical protein [Polyangiaceae bacterium]
MGDASEYASLTPLLRSGEPLTGSSSQPKLGLAASGSRAGSKVPAPLGAPAAWLMPPAQPRFDDAGSR